MTKFRHFLRVSGIFVLLLLNANPGIGQQLGFYFENPHKRVSIPFELYNNLIIAKASINDTNSLNFIIDTGVRPAILLDKAFADSIGMKYLRDIDLYGVANEKPVKALVTSGVDLTMKNLRSNNLSMLVLEENLLQLDRHLGVNIHGILGYDLFSRFVVKINYQKMQIDLFEPTDFQPPQSYSEIDIELSESKPMIILEIVQENSDSINAKLLIDTGASHALVLNPLSNREIIVPENHIYANLGRSISGELEGILGRVSRVTLDNQILDDVIVSYISENPDGDSRNGSVGGELLRKFTVIFDYYHSKLYLKPNGFFKHSFEYNMSGLEFIAKGDDFEYFVINSIRVGSAADDKGFMPGDRLVALNNLPERELNLSKIYSELSAREGKEVTLTVNRAGVFISKTFRLKKEI